MYSAPETQTDSLSQMQALQACSREWSSDLCIGLLVLNLGILGRAQEMVQADTVRVLWGTMPPREVKEISLFALSRPLYPFNCARTLDAAFSAPLLNDPEFNFFIRRKTRRSGDLR